LGAPASEKGEEGETQVVIPVERPQAGVDTAFGGIGMLGGMGGMGGGGNMAVGVLLFAIIAGACILWYSRVKLMSAWTTPFMRTASWGGFGMGGGGGGGDGGDGGGVEKRGLLSPIGEGAKERWSDGWSDEDDWNGQGLIAVAVH